MSSESGVGAGSQSAPRFQVRLWRVAWRPGSAALSWAALLNVPLSRQSEERSVLFAVGSALVNCTNSYDYEEPDPKMVELAKYAKQHVPEQHPKVRACEEAWGRGSS